MAKTRREQGQAVKVVDAERGTIGGWAIPFGGPIDGKDLDGEFFDAETDFALDWFPGEGRPSLYDHGFDKSVKASVVGRQFMKELDPELGMWAEVQLNMAHRYAEAILELTQKSALGFSSGAMKHLIVADQATGHILRWPWVELSLTPMPANPYALIAPDAVKHLEALALDVPAGLKRALDELKKAVAVHHTATSEASWDGPGNEARLRTGEDAAYYAKGFAWRDPEQDGSAKAHWKFIHHEVAADGAVGAANLRGCSAAIAVLNGGRGGTTIPDADREGVWRHVAAHLEDADREPPELRSVTTRFKLSAQVEHVHADVQALVERAKSLAELRAQDGRGLSEAAYAGLVEVRAELDELLRAAAPPVKGLEQELLRFERFLARQQGVAVSA